MAVAPDDNSTFADYAHPERLVSTDWLAGQLNDGAVGTRDVVLLESDEDVLLYDTGHIPGAVKIDWHLDLNDAVMRDYVNGQRFAQVLGERGIGRDTTVVIYGDKSNWWAAYALWVFTLFGHPDVRLLNGGRAKWVAEGREMTREVPTPTPVEYPVVARRDSPIRAFKDDVLAPTDDVVAYCRIGERSSHTWFVLTHLLGFTKVRNYDGSWTEWGNAVQVPIERGAS
jgi:thiosulfate/3-mercaptopyruvate sulfurtransferase